MPLRNDETISDEAILFRVLIADPNWKTRESDGRYRPTSLAFYSADQDVSYFVDGPGVVEALNKLFAGLEIASVPASVIRGVGFVIERRPEECPEDFECDRSCHVVAGPAEPIPRKDHQRRVRTIAKHPRVYVNEPQQR